MLFENAYASSFTLDHSFKGIGIGKHTLNKQITGKVEQMLSNLDTYSPEFILFWTEYNKISIILYELKVHLYE